MKDQVNRVLRSAGFQSHELLIAGVSGGVDSMVMLDLLRELPVRLKVVHVNYGLRGEASDADEACVRAYCTEHGIACEVVKWTAEKPGTNLQAEARTFRYEAFETALVGQPGRIILAHHADDQAEQFLLAAIRALDPGALGGMREVSPDGLRLRPLLGFTKAEIRHYAATHGVPFREDASNAQPDYLRNALRINILPELETLRPGTTAHFVKLTQRLQDQQEILERALARHENWPVAENFATENWRGDAWDREVLRRWTAQWGLPAGAAEEIPRLERIGARYEANGVRVTRERAAWAFERTADKAVNWHLIEEELPAPDAEILRTSQEAECWCDMETLQHPLVVRPWRAGDRLQTWAGPSAKVSDLLTQAKVPAGRRENWPVVTDASDQILWLPHIRRSARAPITSTTTRALRLRLDPDPQADRR
jgi:tRNA(Ile)-lysidine synthase